MCKNFECRNLEPTGKVKDKTYRCRLDNSMCVPFVKSLIDGSCMFENLVELNGVNKCDVFRKCNDVCVMCKHDGGCLYNVHR